MKALLFLFLALPAIHSTDFNNEMRSLLKVNAEYDEILNKIAPEYSSKWPLFKREFIRKNRFDAYLQLLNSQCTVKMLQSTILRAQVAINHGLNAYSDKELISQINSMQRDLDHDKDKAKLVILRAEVEAKQEFIKIMSK